MPKSVVEQYVKRLRNFEAISPPLARQEPSLDEFINFAVTHQDCKTPKPLPAALAVSTHAVGGRGKRLQAIVHGDLPVGSYLR
jgi:hypothetical protein